MCSKNRISQHTQESHMNTRILGGNPIREKTTAAVISVFNFYYKENFLQPCTGADSYQHAGTHLQKATTFSRLPASPGRELRPPALIYQPLLEGSYNPLTEGFDPQHHCKPRFINFQTGSNSFNTTLHISTNILCLLLPTEQWNHCNQNIKDNPEFRINMQKHFQPWATTSSETIRAFT